MPEDVLTFSVKQSNVEFNLSDLDLAELSKLVHVSLPAVAIKHPGKRVKLDLKVGVLEMSPGTNKDQRVIVFRSFETYIRHESSYHAILQHRKMPNDQASLLSH